MPSVEPTPIKGSGPLGPMAEAFVAGLVPRPDVAGPLRRGARDQQIRPKPAQSCPRQNDQSSPGAALTSFGASADGASSEPRTDSVSAL